MPFTFVAAIIMHENYNILLQKLSRFKRRFYMNRLFRGGIWFIAAFVIFFLLINAFEYFTWSSPRVRTALFYAYLVLNLFILISLVIIPLFKLFRIGKTMNEEEAAAIIGSHFPEVKDKLINTIQLKRLSEENGTLELLEAGIEQKTKSLHPVPFVKAVDLRKNRKYLKYAIPPLLVLIILLMASPSIITDPSERLIRHRQAFEKPLPFSIHILNEKLQAMQYDDFTLRVRVDGEQLPAGMYFSLNANLIPFQKESPGVFVYTLNKLQQNMQFSILAEDYSFGPFQIEVLPKPVITNYEVAMSYPLHTGKADEVFENTGDFVVPEGTQAAWKVITRDTREIMFRFPGEKVLLKEEGSNAFRYKSRLMESMLYSISAANEHQLNPDTLTYAITVIQDIYPTAIFEEYRDSVYDKRLYFNGQISDDYGFSGMTFNYEFLNNFDSLKVENKVYAEPVAISLESTKQLVFHHFNLNRLELRPGDEVQYYFEIWDNDGINGYKSSRSHKMIFRAPTIDEITAQTETENQEIKDEMEDIIMEAQLLQEQIEKLNKQLINKESLNWQDKEQVSNLLNQQEQLQDRMELLQEKTARNFEQEQEYKKQNDEILQKQQELQELFEEVMDEEMKALFEELQKMLDELKKEDVQDMLQKMEMSADDIEKELDKNLELFKQFEFDKKLTETIDKLNELAKEQEELAEKSEQKDGESEEMAKEQEGLKEEFEEVKEDLEELEKLNEELENSHELQDTEEMEQEIDTEMENSLEKLQDGKMKKAAEAQKKAAEEMEEMAEMLLNMQSSMQSQSDAEDIAVLREILENLLVISFEQEDIIGDLNNTNFADPRYQEIVQRQFELEENMKLVEDSLYALSKRQAMIKPFISKEVDKVNENIADANKHLQDRKKGNASMSQQYAMTSMNNLALFLSEAMNQMQQNMNMPGNASCDNPGGSNPSQMPKNMGEMQKQLNEQMQQMKDGQGKDGKDGEQGKQGNKSASEQFARMAAEQEMIRQQMQEYLENLKASGEAGDGGLNKLMEEMEKTEQDLVNKRLTEETLQRQEEIYTRLLKHEKASREREKEERRESKEAKNQDYSNPNNFLEYKRILSKEVELLKTVPPDLKPYYKRKVNNYFYNFGN